MNDGGLSVLQQAIDGWRPAPVRDSERFDRSVADAVAGIWNVEPPRDRVPPLWHWFHFLEWTPHENLGPDGHPLTGAFLPPVPNRTRMFAGGSCVWRREMQYGRKVDRVRSLSETKITTGRSGALLFVTVRTELVQDDEVCVVETQDVVYRSGAAERDLRNLALATDPPGNAAAESLPLVADSAMLFRMSALTANHHRIHYDQPYAVEVEHYPGLVVHGILLVLHAMEIPRRSQSERLPSRLDYRLRSPVFVGEPVLASAFAADDGSSTLRVASERDDRHVEGRVAW